MVEKQISIDEKFRQVENIEKEIKFGAFGKTTVKRNKSNKQR